MDKKLMVKNASDIDHDVVCIFTFFLYIEM